MNTHELKIWPVHFKNVMSGTKTFEIRKNDRAFQKGDAVVLKEYRPDTKDEYIHGDDFIDSAIVKKVIGFTGNTVTFKIGDVYPIDAERVVFSLLRITAEE
jgi:hypothetical protein